MLPTRFDIERAVIRSTLPPTSRHLCHVLCIRIDAKTHEILAMYQPSLTELARDTGLHRRTVIRHLAILERLGWVTRDRPTPADARSKHARTQYQIDIGRSPVASDNVPSGRRKKASDTEPLKLVTRSPQARGSVPPNSSKSSRSSEPEINAIIQAIKEHTGVTVDQEWAVRVRDQVLGASDRVRDPGRYITRVIKGAPRDTYLPTPQPPAFTKEGFS